MNQFGLLKKVLNFSAERYLKTAGNLFIYDGDYETALCLVDKTLEIEPGNARALVLKGDILFCMNRDLEALHIFNHVLTLDPACPEAFISKAGVLDVLGRHRESLECCNRAFSLITSRNAYLYTSLYDQKLVLLIRMKRFREAQRLLEDAEGHLPEDEYQYLLTCYKALIDQCCRERKRVRGNAHTPNLKLLTNSLSTGKQ